MADMVSGKNLLLHFLLRVRYGFFPRNELLKSRRPMISGIVRQAFSKSYLMMDLK